MRVLLVGSGGREHALAWALAASPLLSALFVAPGNPGTATLGTNVAIAAEDIAGLVRFAREQRIDLVLPGPEAPLVAGLADALAEIGIACCGPTAPAARLEGSKSFTKEVCAAAAIPTAAAALFTDAAAARAHLARHGAPVVVKADGLAAGKGVVVAETLAEAEAAVSAMLEEGAFGAAGARVLIEECLRGREVSLFALCDGTDAVLLGAAADHKRVGDGDRGPNTGGMGAISPPAGFTDAEAEEAMARIVRPALAEMARRGTPFRGILFAGLMLTAQGPKLIEFNVRFGDPECQALVLRLASDLLPALVAACEGELGNFTLRLCAQTAVAVVMAARGYPGPSAKGGEIRGIGAASALAGAFVFHAGTRAEDGRILADGGRVLTVCGTGRDGAEARARAYAAVDAIDWPEGFCRRDIGARG
ncbi:MAG: phosphoribosylamine--glycine ligase [Acetobacteraceae bacterium]